MGNLDDILNDDGTQVLPTVEEKSKELGNEISTALTKYGLATEKAVQANDLELLQQINDRLSGRKAGKQRTRTTAAGDTTFDKVHVVILVVGVLFGLVAGKIVAGILQTDVFDGPKFQEVSGEISLLIVLIFMVIGGWLGHLANNKIRN